MLVSPIRLNYDLSMSSDAFGWPCGYGRPAKLKQTVNFFLITTRNVNVIIPLEQNPVLQPHIRHGTLCRHRQHIDTSLNGMKNVFV